MKRRLPTFVSLSLSWIVSGTAFADTVMLGDRRHDDVYVIESPRAYYICLPTEGRTLSVAKSDPLLNELSISDDAAGRAALYAEFIARKTQRDRTPDPGPAQSDSPDFEFNFEMGSRDPSFNRSSSDPPAVPVLRLKGEPRAAPPELQTIIDSNLGIVARQSGGGGGGNGSGGGAGGGGLGGGGGGGFGGGGFGGGGAAAGGGAGGFAGGGGAAGGGAGGGRGVGGFTNISELFSTISDAEVGESPNPITGR